MSGGSHLTTYTNIAFNIIRKYPNGFNSILATFEWNATYLVGSILLLLLSSSSEVAANYLYLLHTAHYYQQHATTTVTLAEQAGYIRLKRLKASSYLCCFIDNLSTFLTLLFLRKRFAQLAAPESLWLSPESVPVCS